MYAVVAHVARGEKPRIPRLPLHVERPVFGVRKLISRIVAAENVGSGAVLIFAALGSNAVMALGLFGAGGGAEPKGTSRVPVELAFTWLTNGNAT